MESTALWPRVWDIDTHLVCGSVLLSSASSCTCGALFVHPLGEGYLGYFRWSAFEVGGS